MCKKVTHVTYPSKDLNRATKFLDLRGFYFFQESLRNDFVSFNFCDECYRRIAELFLFFLLFCVSYLRRIKQNPYWINLLSVCLSVMTHFSGTRVSIKLKFISTTQVSGALFSSRTMLFQVPPGTTPRLSRLYPEETYCSTDQGKIANSINFYLYLII